VPTQELPLIHAARQSPRLPMSAPGARRALGLTALWGRAVETHAQNQFLHFINPSGDVNDWTYGQFDTLVGLSAQQLRDRGVGQGTHVQCALFNSPELLVCWLAAARLGADFSLTDPNALDTAAGTDTDAAQAAALIIAGRGPGRPGTAAYAGSDVLEVNEDFAGMLAGSPLFAEVTFTAAQAGAALRPTAAQRNQGAAQARSFLAAADEQAARLPQTVANRWLVATPLWQNSALDACLIPAIAAGDSTGLAALFDPAAIVEQSARLHADRLHLTDVGAQHVIAEASRAPADSPLECVWVPEGVSALEQRMLGKVLGVHRDRVLSGPLR